jgi:hypothetical protein
MPSTRHLSYAALMVAAGLTGVYAETIPNFEVLTLVVFLSGVLLGAGWGATVGGVSMLAYSLLNPYGPVHPLVTVSQVAGTLVAGPAGAWFVKLGFEGRPAAVRVVVMVINAVLLTAWFDALTNLATGILFGQIRMTMLGGIPFALWHIATNVALFAALGTPLVVVFARYRSRLS